MTDRKSMARSNPAFKRRKGQEKGIIEENQHAEVAAAGSPSFTRFITAKTTHHSAYCCRLCVPKKFREEHAIPDHVTMTDATGKRVWKMRFHAAPSATISNGWREFSYDHSLRLNDELLFTLVSPSHFHVAFAAARRPMHPTRREDSGYPWRQNYYRLACLSSISHPKQLQENVVTASPTEEKETDVSVLVNAANAEAKGQSSDEKYAKEMFCPGVQDIQGGQPTTYLERTNPDGSTYLQIVDSGSEID